jgi:hypothetical protein
MNALSHEKIALDGVRVVFYKATPYYNIIDAIALFQGIERSHAKIYYYTLMSRLRQNKENLPEIVKLKAIARDGKAYLMDFTTLEGLQEFKNYSQKTIKQRNTRENVRQDSELENFQPRVIQILQDQGWQIQTQFRLQSQSVIDIVAFHQAEFLIIECKPKLPKNKLYQAIGQTLCYASEFSVPAQPCIATEKDQITPYIEMCCESLNIKIITA